jgi:3-dehydroquinate synthase
VVEEDERENGPRRVLNFGHTVGHVLEHLAGGGLLHGEAVAWGMAAAIRLSAEHAGLEQGVAVELEAFLLGRPGLPRPASPEREAFFRLLERDKKRRGRAIDLVLLRSVGQTLISREIGPEEIWQAARDVIDAGGRGKAHAP